MKNPETPADQQSFSRRSLLASAAVVAGTAFGTSFSLADEKPAVVNGRINQSVVPWCFRPKMNTEQLCIVAKQLGLKSVELCKEKDFATLKKHGLICAITSSHGFTKGWNNLENHDYCREQLTLAIETTAAAGFPAVITFSGMREDLTDEEGKDNMVKGLKTIIGLAEKHKVNICIEPLNSRVDVTMKGHPGYQCDKVEWAVEVCDRVGSENLKILFDIYHTQIMQGDVITRIRQYKDYIGHYHTAGVPGRNELDDEQEINYPAIMKEIVATGYQGYVGQEFIPKHQDDMVGSLRQAIKLCDV
ncbi:MAG: hydroxypyruvate isomerase family protein [Pirellulales bacterium]